MTRILGVDLGLKRTGLAISDELRLTARALPNLTPKSRAQDVAFLLALIEREGVGDVVIGLASLRSGDDSAMAKRARGFAQALENALAESKIEARVHLVDESGTSKRAAQRLVESGVKKSQRKAELDGEVARGLVLEFAERIEKSAR